MAGRLQPFHDLPASQFEVLKSDIAKRGVLIPIVVDENDTTIDGHQRRRAAAEVGAECPRQVLEGLSDDEKESLALALNAFRRHLSGVERSQAIQKLKNLGWSQRRIAEVVGITQPAVSQSLKATGDKSVITSKPEEQPQEEPAVVVGRDGKNYPAQKEPPVVDEALEQRRAEVKRLYEAGLKRSMIAERLDMTDAQVSSDIRVLGIANRYARGLEPALASVDRTVHLLSDIAGPLLTALGQLNGTSVDPTVVSQWDRLINPDRGGIGSALAQLRSYIKENT